MGMKVTWPTPERLAKLKDMMWNEASTDKIIDTLREIEGPPNTPEDWPKLLKWCRHWGYDRAPHLCDPKVVKRANIEYRRQMGRPLTGVRRDADPDAARRPAPVLQQHPCAACRTMFLRKSPFITRCEPCRKALALHMDFG